MMMRIEHILVIQVISFDTSFTKDGEVSASAGWFHVVVVSDGGNPSKNNLI